MLGRLQLATIAYVQTSFVRVSDAVKGVASEVSPCVHEFRHGSIASRGASSKHPNGAATSFRKHSSSSQTINCKFRRDDSI